MLLFKFATIGRIFLCRRRARKTRPGLQQRVPPKPIDWRVTPVYRTLLQNSRANSPTLNSNTNHIPTSPYGHLLRSPAFPQKPYRHKNQNQNTISYSCTGWRKPTWPTNDTAHGSDAAIPTSDPSRSDPIFPTMSAAGNANAMLSSTCPNRTRYDRLKTIHVANPAINAP